MNFGRSLFAQQLYSYLEQPYKLSEKLDKLFRLNKLDEVKRILGEAKPSAHSSPVWNKLIQEYGKRGLLKEVRLSYNQMKKRGLKPTQHTYTNLINAFTYAKDETAGIKWAMDYLSSIPPELKCTAHINAALNVCRSLKRYDEMMELYGKEQAYMDNISYTILIDAFSKSTEADNFSRGFGLWKKYLGQVMLKKLEMDSKVVTAFMKICLYSYRSERIELVDSIFETIYGINPQNPTIPAKESVNMPVNSHAVDIALRALSKRKMYIEAIAFFDHIKSKMIIDTNIYNSVIRAYINSKMDVALILQEMEKAGVMKDTLTYELLMDHAHLKKNSDLAEATYKEMKTKNVPLSEKVLLSLLQAVKKDATKVRSYCDAESSLIAKFPGKSVQWIEKLYARK